MQRVAEMARAGIGDRGAEADAAVQPASAAAGKYANWVPTPEILD
jgi:hypothetical protein